MDVYISNLFPDQTTYLKGEIKLLLLLVYDAEPEIDLIGLFKLGVHLHDCREGFFSVFQGAVTIIQDTNAIPEFWILECRRVITNPYCKSEDNTITFGLER